MRKVRFEDIFYHDVIIEDIVIARRSTNTDIKLMTITLRNENNIVSKCILENAFAVSLRTNFNNLGQEHISSIEKITNDGWIDEEIKVIHILQPNYNLLRLVCFRIQTTLGTSLKILLDSEYVFIE